MRTEIITGRNKADISFRTQVTEIGGLRTVVKGIPTEWFLKEDKSNKVQTLGADSTEKEYPSAKCVYEAIQNIDFPDNYEIGEVYLGNRAGLTTSPNDIHMRIFKNGEGAGTETFTMEIIITGGGSSYSAGRHEFTTDTDGYVPPLQEINNISEVYIQHWLRGKFSNSSLNVNVYALDRSTLLCSTTVTRNILADQVAGDNNYAVVSSAVYDYSEAKSNKVTSISSNSTNTEYPSALAVYNYIQSLDGSQISY